MQRHASRSTTEGVVDSSPSLSAQVKRECVSTALSIRSNSCSILSNSCSILSNNSHLPGGTRNRRTSPRRWRRNTYDCGSSRSGASSYSSNVTAHSSNSGSSSIDRNERRTPASHLRASIREAERFTHLSKCQAGPGRHGGVVPRNGRNLAGDQAREPSEVHAIKVAHPAQMQWIVQWLNRDLHQTGDIVVGARSCQRPRLFIESPLSMETPLALRTGRLSDQSNRASTRPHETRKLGSRKWPPTSL